MGEGGRDKYSLNYHHKKLRRLQKKRKPYILTNVF